VQFDASALLAIGAGVSDIFAILCPGNIVIALFHFPDEVCFGWTAFHGLADVVHQLELPTCAADGGTILSG
jgi:hypothetical protein